MAPSNPAPWHAWRRALLRFVCAALLLTAGALAWQDRIVQAFVPAFRAWLVLIDDTYLTVDLSLVEDHGETMLRRLCSPLAAHRVGGHAVPADARTQISTQVSAGIVLQPLILAAAILLAWPAAGPREYAWRAIAAFPLLAVVLALDVPMMLYGFAWFDELRLLDPDRFSALVTWADAMNAGGRFALTITAAGASIWFGLRRSAHAPRPSPWR